MPDGMCLRTTQLLVLLVACPPGPDPLTNCSSKCSSFRLSKSIRSFFPAARMRGKPTDTGDKRSRPGNLGSRVNVCPAITISRDSTYDGISSSYGRDFETIMKYIIFQMFRKPVKYRHIIWVLVTCTCIPRTHYVIFHGRSSDILLS